MIRCWHYIYAFSLNSGSCSSENIIQNPVAFFIESPCIDKSIRYHILMFVLFCFGSISCYCCYILHSPRPPSSLKCVKMYFFVFALFPVSSFKFFTLQCQWCIHSYNSLSLYINRLVCCNIKWYSVNILQTWIFKVYICYL